MSYDYAFNEYCGQNTSGMWEQTLEVTPGEHGIKLNVELNIDVVSRDHEGSFIDTGAVEKIIPINWPDGLTGRIEVHDAYRHWHSHWSGVQYETEIEAPPPSNLAKRPIAYKQECNFSRMQIRLHINWLSNTKCDEIPEDLTSAAVVSEPDFTLNASDDVRLYLKGDWIDDFSTLLKRYREGNYDQKMSKSEDGCFECPDFDAETLQVLFCYGQCKKVWSPFQDRFVDVMRAADYFGANRACGELFAMETRRLIHKGGTEDNGWEGTNPMSAREYLDLWHHAINYNFPEMKLMLARHTHSFIDEMKKNQAIYDEYCKLMAGISN